MPWLTNLGKFVLATLLFSPYLILFFNLPQIQLPQWQELSAVLWIGGRQAVLSAILALIFGFFGALGLLFFRNKRRKVFEFVLLVPSFLPALTVLTSLLNIWPRHFEFPFNWLGVVLVHVVISVGLIAVSLGRTIEQKLGALGELAYLEGASVFYFWRRAGFALILPQCLRLFFAVFIFCFTSFSVPLIVGGAGGGTVETLIFEKIRVGNSWGEALGLAFFQMLIVLLAAWILKVRDDAKAKSYIYSSWLSLPLAIVFPLFCSFIILLGMIHGSWIGYKQIFIEPSFFQSLVFATTKTVIISCSVGFTIFLLCAWTAWVGLNSRMERLILGLVSPSAALTGLALLIISFPPLIAEEMRIIIGLSLLFYPALMRISGAGVIKSLASQVEIARTMGANDWQVFSKVVWPQVLPTFGFLSGLGAFWASGDFAISSIVARSDLTLALVIKNLLSFYRIEMATFLLWPLLICGALIFSLFVGWNNVAVKKFNP